jgi:hypothetical protein
VPTSDTPKLFKHVLGVKRTREKFKARFVDSGVFCLAYTERRKEDKTTSWVQNPNEQRSLNSVHWVHSNIAENNIRSRMFGPFDSVFATMESQRLIAV